MAAPTQPSEETLDIRTILAEPPELGIEQALKQIESCVNRILDMEPYFQLPSTLSTNQAKILSKSNDSLISARFGWMLMVVRTITRSNSDTEMLKNRFLFYIMQNFRTRYISKPVLI